MFFILGVNVFYIYDRVRGVGFAGVAGEGPRGRERTPTYMYILSDVEDRVSLRSPQWVKGHRTR